MGVYLNPDNSKFQEAINSAVYVDKTGLLSYTNKVMDTRISDQEQQYHGINPPYQKSCPS